MRKNIVTTFVALAVAFSATFGSVMPALAALSAPGNLTIDTYYSTNDTTPTFTWTAPSGATWYEGQVDNGSWFSLGNVQSYTVWNQAEGWHTFFVRAHNNAGEISTTASFTFEIDITGPTVSIVSPLTATTGVPVTFTITAGSSDVAAGSCQLNIDGYTYSMKRNDSSYWNRHFILSHTFTYAGPFGVGARCQDGDGNYTTGSVTTVRVSGNTVSSIPAVFVTKGTAVKTACDSYAPKSDSCHSIYYYGTDGKRHAFPTESVYMSWFSNYSNVVTIANSAMNAMPVGENVTYHPGSVLVKFSGSSTVYAIEKGAILRPFMNEAAAIATYGRNYSRYIVMMSTSMKNDYTFSAKIWSSGDYSKVAAYASASTIDKNFSTKVVID